MKYIYLYPGFLVCSWWDWNLYSQSLIYFNLYFICSVRITPVVFVLLSNRICNGNVLLVFVIGHTTANLVLIKNWSLLIIIPGILPACSCPDCVLKSKNTISPCFGWYITTLPFQQVNPSQIMAEIEIGIMSRQALAKPFADIESFKGQARIWTIKRNSECRKINR